MEWKKWATIEIFEKIVRYVENVLESFYRRFQNVFGMFLECFELADICDLCA